MITSNPMQLKARIKNLATEKNLPAQIVLQNYLMERLLERLSRNIADTLEITQKTVENHRNNLREKLGLKNKGVNLQSFLMNMGAEEGM